MLTKNIYYVQSNMYQWKIAAKIYIYKYVYIYIYIYIYIYRERERERESGRKQRDEQ